MTERTENMVMPSGTPPPSGSPLDAGGSLSLAVKQYVAEQLPSVAAGSVAEIFLVLLQRAARAAAARNYGVAAALTVALDDVELVAFGANSVYSGRDPVGHAETNAIRNLRALLGDGDAWRAPRIAPWRSAKEVADSDGQLFLRALRQTGAGVDSTLYTSLEPCPMCTVAIINAGISRVVIASPEPRGGSLAAERLARLPSVWGELASRRELAVDFVGAASGQGSDLHLPPRLASLLDEVFLQSEAWPDAWLDARGFMKSMTSPDLARRLLAESEALP